MMMIPFSLQSGAQAASCGIEAAVELFPCAEVDGTEPIKTCCNGLFVNVAQVGGANVQRWAEAGCFCIDDIINYDKPYFDKVTALAAKCTGNANLESKVKGNCPTTPPANGFTSYANAAAVKAAMEAMDPKVPPGPPPRPPPSRRRRSSSASSAPPRRRRSWRMPSPPSWACSPAR
jgi:hypothetical protein